MPRRQAERADLPHERVAVLARHTDVAEEDVRPPARECGERLGGRLAHPDVGTVPPQDRLENLARVRLVVDHEDAEAVEPSARRGGWRLRLGRTRRRLPGRDLDRQPHREGGALTLARALRVHGAPCSSTMWRTIARPRPRPPCVPLLEASPCRKRSKTCGRKAGEMPLPVSRTVSSRYVPAGRSRSSTRPFSGVKLIAFERRFHATCWRRCASPRIGWTPGWIAFTTRMSLAMAAGRTPSIAASITSARRTAFTSRRIFPLMMRDTSSRSSTRCACALALRSIASSARDTRAGSSVPRLSWLTQARIGVSGVRSSCERVARNSSFRRLVSSALRYS